MKAMCGLVLVLSFALVLIPAWGEAQSKEQGVTLLKEGDQLRKQAKSDQDRTRVLQKYEEALKVFEKTGAQKEVASTLNRIGQVYSASSQYTKALPYYEKGLDVSRRTGQASLEAASCTHLGQVYLVLGQNQKALDHFNDALAVNRRLGDVKGESSALNNIGRVYERWGQYAKALENYERALELKGKAGDMIGQGHVLHNMGQVYRALAQYDKAMECYEKALEIKKRSGDQRAEAVTLNDLGLMNQTKGEYKKALEYYEKSLEIHKKVGNLKEEGTNYNNLATLYKDWGQLQKALQYLQKSLEIRKKVDDVQGEATTLFNLGQVYRLSGQYKKALEYYTQSLDLKKKLSEPRGEGINLNDIGLIYKNWGQHRKAMEYYEKALSIYRRIGDVKEQAVTLGNIGAVNASWGQYQEALGYYDKSLEVRRKIGDRVGEAGMLNMVGTIYTHLGKNEEALANYRQALTVYEKIGAPTKWTKDLIGNLYLDTDRVDAAEPFIKEGGYWASLGRLYLLKQDSAKAKEFYEKLLKSSEKSGHVDSRFAAYTGLGKVHEAQEDYGKAVEYYDKGMKLAEQIRAALLPAERKSFFEVRIQGFYRSEPAKGLTRVRMKLNQASGSIESSEVTRARAFADTIALRSQTGYAGVPKDVLEKEDDLITRRASVRKALQAAGQADNREKYGNLRKDYETVQKELKEFLSMLRQKFPAYAAVKYPQPVTLKESALRPEECVVIFDVSDEGVGVKLIRGKEIKETYFNKWPLSQLQSDIRTFRNCFEQVKFEQFDPELGRALYRKLLGRVLMEVPPGTPLTIIPDGILAVLPFEALVVSGKTTWKEERWGKSPGGLTFLGDLFPISYYQSITALTLARAQVSKSKPGSRMLVVADPVFNLADERAQDARQVQVAEADKEYQTRLMVAVEEAAGGSFKLPRLVRTASLADNLGKIYGRDSEILMGLKANKNHFLSVVAPKLDQYGWVVFATHGVIETRIPGINEPFLALSMVPPGADGYLTMTDVMGLKMNADVVALTACQTGLGKELSGEGVMSMGRAFQYAGSRAVLMSLWSVEETASVMLVERFFTHLKAGKKKLEALRLARDEIRKQGFDHPFFWTAFILVGEVN